MKIDSHQHFWHFNTDDYGWMGDNMSAIKRDFLPDDLKVELAKINFDGSVAVQARQSLEETNWLLKLASECTHIKGVVGWLDLQSEDIKTQLEAFVKHPKAVGVRHVIHDEPDVDFMLRPDFLRGVNLLSEYKLAYDILIFPIHLKNTIEFVGEFSDNQVFVVDHIAKPYIKDQLMSPWKEQIAELAAYKNVYCKLSGMVTEADWNNWTSTDIEKYIEVVVNAFGIDRVMIGSDWPVCLVAGTYSKVMNVVINFLNKLPESEKDKVLGLNAIKAYNLK